MFVFLYTFLSWLYFCKILSCAFGFTGRNVFCFFLFAGDVIRHQNIIEHIDRLGIKHIILMITLWMVVVLFAKDDLNMASCRYDEGFVRIPISIIATLLVLYFCKKLNSYNVKLSRIGNNTLYILIGHQLFNYVCWETGFDFIFLRRLYPPGSSFH